MQYLIWLSASFDDFISYVTISIRKLYNLAPPMLCMGGPDEMVYIDSKLDDYYNGLCVE